MIKYASLFVLGLLFSCASNDLPGGGSHPKDVLQIQPIMDLTPFAAGIDRAQIEVLDRELRRSLGQWVNQEGRISECMRTVSVWVQPRLVYGVDTTQNQTRFISDWSALVRLTSMMSGVSAQVDIVLEHSQRPGENKTVNHALSQGVVQFAEFVGKMLRVLSRSPSELTDVLKSGSYAEKKILLERMSVCGEHEFDIQLDHALTFATDEDVRFRLVGLIGERKRHGAADQLIDLINLNDIEWTRSIIRTLSTLEHPRTLELISILAVHDSPALQKELKSALDRLERK